MTAEGPPSPVSLSTKSPLAQEEPSTHTQTGAEPSTCRDGETKTLEDGHWMLGRSASALARIGTVCGGECSKDQGSTYPQCMQSGAEAGNNLVKTV